MKRKHKKSRATSGVVTSHVATSHVAEAIPRLDAPPKVDWPLLVGIAFISLIFPIHWLATDAPYLGSGTDIVTFEYPALAFAHSRLALGDLPLWNPYSFGGSPFWLGAHSFVSPSYWTTAFLPPLWDIKVGFLLHFALAATGTAWWVRSRGMSRPVAVTAAMAFALSGFTMSHAFAGHRALVFTAACLPWVMGGISRWLRHGRWGVAVASATFMLLGGHYHVVYIGWLGMGLHTILEEALRARSPHAASAPHSPPARTTEPKTRATIASGGVTRAIRVLAITAGLSALLSLVNLLPTATTVALSQRSQGGLAFASSYASAPQNLATYLIPTLFGGGHDHPFVGSWAFWESLGYLGLVPAFCLLTAPLFLHWRVWVPTAIVLALATALSLGLATPLFEPYVAIVPGADMFRSPGRFVLLTTLFGSFLTARTLQAWLDRGQQSWRRPQRVALFVPAVLMISVWLSIRTHDASSWHAWLGDFAGAPKRGEPPLAAWQSLLDAAHSETVLASAATLALAVAFVWTGSEPRRRAVLWGVATFTCVELYFFGQPFLNTGGSDRFALPPKAAAMLEQRYEPGLRIVTDPNARIPGRAAAVGIAQLGGYDTFLMRNAATYANLARGRDPDRFAAFVKFATFNPYVAHTGPRYLLTRRRLGRSALQRRGWRGWKEIDRAQGFVLYENPRPTPRAWLSHSARHMAKDRAARRLGRQDHQLLAQTLLTTPLPAGYALDHPAPTTPALPAAPTDSASPPYPTTQDAETVRIIRYEPDIVTMQVEANAAGLVVLSDTWHPGWRAFVDGQEAPIIEANLFMRAVPVAAGSHLVEQRFEPTSLVAGAWISLASLFAVLSWRWRTIARGHREAQRRPPKQPLDPQERAKKRQRKRRRDRHV
ncbi:MAG: YfhO family protein [Nannocystaceae bacterium]